MIVITDGNFAGTALGAALAQEGMRLGSKGGSHAAPSFTSAKKSSAFTWPLVTS